MTSVVELVAECMLEKLGLRLSCTAIDEELADGVNLGIGLEICDILFGDGGGRWSLLSAVGVPMRVLIGFENSFILLDSFFNVAGGPAEEGGGGGGCGIAVPMGELSRSRWKTAFAAAPAGDVMIG